MPEQSPYSELRMAPLAVTRTRAEQIADAIAGDIVEGRLLPSQKLSEVELARYFQVSRGPVREALSLLERNMLVTIKPRSCTYVNKLTFRELEQLFEFRKQVLSLACRFATRNRNEEDINALEAGYAYLHTAAESNPRDINAQAFPATQLWDLIIDASHSQVVRQACLHLTGGNIWSRAVESRIAKARLPSHGKNRMILWQAVIEAIANQDEEAATAAGSRLVENNWDLLKDSFRQLFPDC